MNKKIELTKLVADMPTKDKAKLLFADCMVKFETLGANQLLNAYELERLMKDAYKNNQIKELNALTDKFNVSCFLLNEIKVCYLNFYVEKVKLEMFLGAVALRDHYEDSLDFLIYDIVSNKFSSEERETGETQKAIDTESQAIRTKYHLTSEDKFSKIFDLFDPPISPESSFSVGNTKHFTPNVLIQKVIVRMVELAKKLNTAIYKFEYLEKLAEVSLVSEKEYAEIEVFKNIVPHFTNLEDSLERLKIYTFKPFINDLNITHIEEPSFFTYLTDLNKATELSEEEKAGASKQVDSLLELV